MIVSNLTVAGCLALLATCEKSMLSTSPAVSQRPEIVTALFTALYKPKLTTAEAAAVRKDTCGQGRSECAPTVEYPFVSLYVPKSVRYLYSIKPRATVNLLLRIGDGAAASDSIVAACYVIEITGKRGSGLMYSRMYEWDKYDEYDPRLKCTYREHVLQVARESFRKSQDKKFGVMPNS